jgi:hypothetical protein
MNTLRLVPNHDHEPDDPTSGAALPVPSGDVITLDGRRRPALARIELEAVAA